MKFFFLILFSLLLTNCNKPKTVLICGDHVCVNKTEAKQYFEENLSIEVKIIDKKSKEEVDLVELNLSKNSNGKKEVTISEKRNTKKEVKILSNQEISIIKENIKNKKKITKKNVKMEKIKQNNNNNFVKNVNKKKEVVDVCTILEKCSIDEISKFLIKQGKMKNFPDITKI